MKPLHPVREADAPDIFEPAPFEIDGVDARSVQKTPAGVLFVRRGLFFVKRQRRCTVYFQKVKSPSILCNFTVYSCFIVFR